MTSAAIRLIPFLLLPSRFSVRVQLPTFGSHFRRSVFGVRYRAMRPTYPPDLNLNTNREARTKKRERGEVPGFYRDRQVFPK